MSVEIKSIDIVPELSSESVDYLLGNLTGKFIATIKVRAVWKAIAGLTADNEDMDFDANTRTITWNLNNFENEGFLIGDTIRICATSSNDGDKTITAIDADVITTAEALVTEASETAIIAGITTVTGINFRYNLLENDANETFLSLLDGNERKFSGADLDFLDPTPIALIQQGVFKSNHIGTVTSAGTATSTANASAGNTMTFTGGATDSIVWNGDNFEDEGFVIGDFITISGTASNNGMFSIKSILGDTIFTNENITNEATVATAVITALHENEFILVHTFFIDPFYLFTQLTDLQNGIAPEYLFDKNSLRYLFEVEMLYELQDPNKAHITNIQDQLIGNVGWFDENFNQGIPGFSITNITFKDILGNVLTFADYANVTFVEIDVNSVDGVFISSSTQYIINHFILPETEAQYVDTSTDETTNFMFDRALATIDGAVVDGDNFGTDKQVLQQVSNTILTPNVVRITCQIDLSADYKARIAALVDKRFILSVTIADHTKATVDSDVVACRSGIQVYDTDLSNPNVGGVSTVFEPYPDITVSSAVAGQFGEDTIRGRSIFFVDTANGALIEDVQILAFATNGVDTFTLEEKNFSFAGGVISNGVQEFDLEEPRGFVLKDDNPFFNTSLKRRSDLDTGTKKFYEIIYPFKIRWEDYVKLANVSGDFYDINEEFNGFNQEWARYFDGIGWTLNYRVTVNIEENTFVNAITSNNLLNAFDYEEATDWTQTLKVFDIGTGLEIPNNVLSDKIFRIEAKFTKVSGGIPALADVEGMIEYEPDGAGGIGVIRNISTVRAHEDDSPFISVNVPGDKLLKKEKAGNVYTFTANIDGTKLTGSPKLSARIYDKTVPPFSGYKQFMDDDLFEFMSGDSYDFQDQ